MELFNKLPFELQGIALSHSHVIRRATPAQLELFQSLPPDVQQKVYNDAFSSDDVRAWLWQVRAQILLVRLLQYA